jgi:hypothetical protein
MRVRNLCAAALAILCTIGVASAHATFVTYDDFSTAGSPGSSKWASFDGATPPTVSGGNLQMDGTATSGWQGIYSTQRFGYGSYQFTLASFNNATACVFGIDSATTTTGAAQDAIHLRNDTGNLISIGGAGVVPMIDYAPTSLPATYTFVWNPNSVQILRNIGAGDTVLYSTTDSALIPVATDTMRFELVAYGSGAYAVNSVAYQAYAVPEPAALVLCVSGLLGLLAYAWRKRK